MKKIYLAIISMVSLMLVACISIESTDLNSIKIDNISLGQSIDTLDLSKYEVKDEIDNEYNYEFKELQIRTNTNNDVDKIWLNILEYNLLSIDKENKFEDIDQITDILGNNYKEYWYDKEQGLKSHKYIDNNNNIKVNFVYDSTSNNKQKELIWVILESI
nr:hypothetical protein [uncultured Romboutsia sp.]